MDCRFQESGLQEAGKRTGIPSDIAGRAPERGFKGSNKGSKRSQCPSRNAEGCTSAMADGAVI